MAGWNRMHLAAHQSFADAIFAAKQIACESYFCWFPAYDRWQGYFKTKFKYLSLNEKHDLNYDFNREYDSFIDAIEQIREKFEREYNYYFNELWC